MTSNIPSFLWSIADLLRGDFKQSEYGKVILPFTVLRRLDCVLEPTKAAVLAEYAKREKSGVNPEPFLVRKANLLFYNTSPLDMKKLMGDQHNVAENLRSYIQGFSPAVRDIFERFEFHTQIDRLDKANLLYLVTEKFASVDLHPDAVPDAEMGSVFEELIRKFAELSNETAGEHYTPREVIRLMVNLLFIEDNEALTKPGIVRSLYDPAQGTGGMLSEAEEYLLGHNPKARLVMHGQELNPESYAICKANMLIKGHDISNIIFGNTLTADGLIGKLFDYMLSNPPFGVDWKKIEDFIRKEAENLGFNGRFGPGLPRVSDGSLLFLLHLISKMRPTKDGGSRIGIVLNGSPMFSGGAGSGESEIRRYILENDLVEAIIALPSDMFYNTGISTYIWILSNRKLPERRGKVQLIDASSFFQKMRKSLGSKRKELSPDHIEDITRIFGDFKQVTRKGVPICRIFKNEDFGYRTIIVERPERDAKGKVMVGTKGKGKGQPLPDATLRETENVPLSEDVETYYKREVLPYSPDSWIDHDKTKIGYEIPFNRYFYVFEPPRSLATIDSELKATTDRILKAVLSQAATEARDNHVPMKPSGIDWLGEVPEHWNVTALKRGFSVTLGKMLQPESSGAEDQLLPYLRAANIQWEGIDTDDIKQMWLSKRDRDALRLKSGDLLVSEGGDVGRSCLWEDELEECYFQNSVNRIRARGEHSNRYLCYWLATIKDKGYVDVLCNKSTIAHFTAEKVAAVPVPFPPPEEQEAIASFLERETEKIDSLIANQQEAIDLLKERRKALIAAAVTGHIAITKYPKGTK